MAKMATPTQVASATALCMARVLCTATASSTDTSDTRELMTWLQADKAMARSELADYHAEAPQAQDLLHDRLSGQAYWPPLAPA